MTIKHLVLCVFVFASHSAFADEIQAKADLAIYDTIGVGTVTFTGPAAAKLYGELNVQIKPLTGQVNQKRGENLSCFEKTSVNQRGQQTKTYRCGMTFVNRTGYVEPMDQSFPQPGLSIGN